MKQLFATLLLLAFFLPFCKAQVVINEYSAANLDAYADNYGEFEDWFEIYNATGAPIDLTGWFLSDKTSNPQKWAIPTGAIIPANGYLIVFCSGRSEISGGNIHTGFKLTQTKPENIIIADAAGTVIDDLSMDACQRGHSRALTSDGGTVWGVDDSPTPGASNNSVKTGYATTPLFDLPSGYTAGGNLNITSPDANVTIHFTTDGSSPNAGSPAVTGAINIAGTQIYRAIAISTDPNILPSFIESNTYIFNTTHTIDIISIAGVEIADLIINGNQGFASDPIGSFEYFGPDGVLIDEGQGQYNKHGNDSWAYAQRGFDFIMRDQLGYNHAVQHKIFNGKSRDEFQKLILKAAANDNYPAESPTASIPGERGSAHIRDAYVHSLSQVAKLKMDERSHEPCIIYINGMYWGVYDIREKVDDHDFTDYYYDQDREDLQFLKTWGGTWSEYGGAQAQNDWDALRNYITTNNMAIQANFDYVDSLYNWHSLVDYFVLNSYIVSQDWLNWNTAWWRGRNQAGDKKKWRYVLWDMDASFEHYINYTGVPDISSDADPCNPESLGDPGGQGHTEILNALTANEDFNQYYISRFIDLANTSLSCASQIAHLDSLIALIEPEMPGQIGLWGGSMTEWKANVQHLKDFINARCTAINQGLIDCYNLDGPYDITFDVQPVGAGEIKVNSAWLPNYPFMGTYFGGIDILLRARANTGYQFAYWETVDTNLIDLDTSETQIRVTQNQTIIAHFVPDGEPLPATYEGAHIPTAFSPNADGNNDWWFVYTGRDIDAINIKIFDRWGEKLYESDDPLEGWDGNYKSKPLNSGVYTYMIKLTHDDGRKETRSGNITLLR